MGKEEEEEEGTRRRWRIKMQECESLHSLNYWVNRYHCLLMICDQYSDSLAWLNVCPLMVEFIADQIETSWPDDETATSRKREKSVKQVNLVNKAMWSLWSDASTFRQIIWLTSFLLSDPFSSLYVSTRDWEKEKEERECSRFERNKSTDRNQAHEFTASEWLAAFKHCEYECNQLESKLELLRLLSQSDSFALGPNRLVE